jgi:hypothetical protein
MSRHCSSGHVYLIEMPVNMLAVICYLQDEDAEPIYSKAYFYGDSNKSTILKNARQTFNKIKEFLLQKKLQLIEELD